MGGGKGGKRSEEGPVDGQREPFMVSMATPPEEALPLFSREQIHDLHSMYQQAPLLYPSFQTPQSVARPVERPPFLKKDEREGVRRLRLEEQREEELKGLEERMRLDRAERDELTLQLQYLMRENQQLKNQALGSYAAERRKEEKEALASLQFQAIMDKNRRLKGQIEHLAFQQESKQEEGLFATPVGSSGLDDEARKAEEQRGHHEEGGAEGGTTGKGTGGKKKETQANDGLPPQTVDVILKLLQGMQDIQKLVKGNQTGDGDEGGGQPELVQFEGELNFQGSQNGHQRQDQSIFLIGFWSSNHSWVTLAAPQKNGGSSVLV